ncbi:MAG TPA: glutamate synthase-related protein [Gammaproteobacteria bacterium]
MFLQREVVMAEWQRICSVASLKEGYGSECWVNGRPLALYLHKGAVYALQDRCPHREGQLSRGKVEGDDAVCPLHGWNFDLKTGISPYNPHDRVATYPVKVEQGEVWIDAAAVEPLPPSTFEGYQGRWRRFADDARGKVEIRKLAKGKVVMIEAMGALPEPLSPIVSFDHFHLQAAQLARMPKLESEAVSVAAVLGRGAGKPLQLALPAYVSHMSFGALSKSAKQALARGSRIGGTLIASGEGGMLPIEREEAALYILEMASGYFGWNEAAQQQADAFEIKIGQSAKPGLGGELPARKVSEEIARVRGIKVGEPAISPARFPDITSLAQLQQRIVELRARYPDKPIGVKFVANDLEADMAAALSLAPDFITVDGFGGGTGSAPGAIRDHFGMPLVMALPRARRLVDQYNREHPERPVTLVATGGIRTPADIAKALALGADICALATASLFALGCEYYRACHTDNCPTGVTTHNRELAARIDIAVGAERVGTFFQSTARVLELYLRAMGLEWIGQLDRHHLIPLSAEAEQIVQMAWRG